MFSLVIPTLNEEKYLPKLLESVKEQKLKPSEIIVADANSEDKTVEIAKKYGCRVVKGGRISIGRNNGAKAAKEEIIVFMDADTILPHKGFFNKIIGKFISKNADVASSYILPSEKRVKYGIPMAGINAVKFITHKLKKNIIIGGACIVVTKEAFNRLGGFDPKIAFREDHDFCQRAVKAGMEFIVIPEFVKVSPRRYEKFGSKKMVVLGVVAVLATVIGGSWLKKKMKGGEKRLWKGVK